MSDCYYSFSYYLKITKINPHSKFFIVLIQIAFNNFNYLPVIFISEHFNTFESLIHHFYYN
jgi:hypothetical protein